MERNRDFRRGTVAAGLNGLPRWRQRITTLKDSADNERQVELKDTVRLRDRERLQKKERDREFPKRRRVDRAVVHQRSGGGGGGGDSYRENESTDSSDEEYFEGEESKNHKGMNQLSPTSSSLSNNRRLLRTHRSAPVFRSPSDEIFGVPVPRRTRSASAKRLQQCWISGKIVFGEDLSHRTFSPATVSSSGFGDDSPPSSSASMRKKMKSSQPRGRNFCSASNSKLSAIQDDIEIEVAEALFDLMKQSHSHSQSSQIQEKADRDSLDTVNCELQRPKPVGVEDENTAFSVQNEQSRETNGETIVVDSTRDLNKKERKAEKEKSPDDLARELVGGDGFVSKGTLGSAKENESPSCVDKVNACDIKDPTTTKAEHAAAVAKKEFRLEIDLMASPPPEKEKGAMVDMESTPKFINWAAQKESGVISQDGAIRSQNVAGEAADRSRLPALEKTWDDILSLNNWTTHQPQGQKEQRNQSSSLFSFPIGTSTWASYTPHPGMPHLQTAMLVDGSTRLSSMAMRPPQFKLPLPRPRRCTTHQYIAKNIAHHMDLIKAFSSGQTSSGTSYGTDSNPKPMFPFSPILGGRVKDKNPVSAGGLSPVTSAKPAIQQPGNHFVYPGFIVPTGHPHTSMMAPAVSSGPPASAVSNAPLTGNSSGKPSANVSTPGGTTAVSYNSQIFPSNGASPYMAILQHNGGPIPIATNIPMPAFKGGSPCMPILNSSVYSSSSFNLNNQQSSFTGSSSRKQPERQQQTGIVVGENKTSTPAAAHHTVQPIWPSYSSSKFEPEIGGKSSSSLVADGRVSHSVISNNHTGSFPAQSMNFAVIPPLSIGNKNGDHSQQGSKNRVELMPQAFALSFNANPSANPAAAANFSSMLQNQAVFQMLPDMARNGTQMSPQKKFLPSEGKFPSNGDHSLNFSKSDGADMPASAAMSTSIFDTLPRAVNYLPSSLSGNQHFHSSSAALTSGPNFQQLHHQQQLTQLQQHHVHQMQLAGTPQAKGSPPNSIPGSFLNSSFPSNNPAFSAQTDISKWMNLPRTQPQEGSSQPATSALGSIPQLKTPQGQAHPTLQRQHLAIRSQPESPSTPSSNSSISKNTGSSSLKAMPSIPALPPVPQEAGTSANGATSQKSPPACRRNIPSILSSHPNQLSELKY